MSDLLAADGTDIGRVHHTNEDSLVRFSSGSAEVLVVCDGMGGMGRGDEASAIAVQVIEEKLTEGEGFPPERMEAAVQAADIEIRRALAVPGNYPGSTAVLVHVENALAHVCWAGDSRAYLIRDGKVTDRTRDHKLVNELVDAGELTEAEAKQSTLAHVVTKALGGRGPNEAPIRPETLQHPWKLHSGDYLLLCSDGLCDLVEDAELPALVEGTNLDEDVARLIQLALDRGGHDNITVIIARWEGRSFDEEAERTPLFYDRDLVPAVTDPSFYEGVDPNTTWEPPDDETLAGPDDETVPPAPERVTPAPAPAAESAEPASETPQVGIAIAIAVVAILLIIIGLLVSQGVFTNNAVSVDEVNGK